MLNWLFEGIVDWVSSVVTNLMDTVSGLFLNALGTDMTAMEEYFPFVSTAFTVMQYMAWSLLFIITVWQLFKNFGGPITEAEEPFGLIMRSSLFAILIYFSKSIFLYVLDIARAPYTALMEIQMPSEDFTFAGIGNIIGNALVGIVSDATVVGALLGLTVNLKFHNFEWSNPAEVVKRGASSTICMFVGMLAVIPVLAVQIAGTLISVYLGFTLVFIILLALAYLFYYLSYKNAEQKLLKM